MNRMIYETTMN